MDDWVVRALKRWPNVPALYGWLTLDRRGRWLIKGESISRLQIIDVINRNYSVDDQGCWYFQNGPQRGYMQLERAPLVVHVVESKTALLTHTQLPVSDVSAVFLDEDGGLYLQTEHGPAALLDADLEWALGHMFVRGHPVDEGQLIQALAVSSGAQTDIVWNADTSRLPLQRLDNSDAPTALKFVRAPTPAENA